MPTAGPPGAPGAPQLGAPGDLGKRLTPWTEHSETAGIFTDFDGTLALMVEDPATAKPVEGVAESLAVLARRYASVAVISGRPVAYLIDRIGPIDGLTLVGLYGLEYAEGGAVVEMEGAPAWRAKVGRAVGAAARLPAGVTVEDKGLTVVLHYRTAPAHADAVTTWAEQVAPDEGLVVHPGKMSVELRPPVGGDKGTVVERLAASLSAACFIGDDVGDLPAFAALRRLRDAGAVTLAVAVNSPEAPPELLGEADLIVDGPTGAAQLLVALTG